MSTIRNKERVNKAQYIALERLDYVINCIEALEFVEVIAGCVEILLHTECMMMEVYTKDRSTKRRQFLIR